LQSAHLDAERTITQQPSRLTASHLDLNGLAVLTVPDAKDAGGVRRTHEGDGRTFLASAIKPIGGEHGHGLGWLQVV
jgi:hypothetical protein